jgi:AcrR family transcriptional regulator
LNQSDYQSRRDARRAEEREHHREQILDAALELFAQRGFAGTAVQEIAAAAGFSVGHIYNLIGNKRALYDAVHDREHENLARVVQDTIDALADRPAIVRLDRLVDATLDFIFERRFFIQIHQHELDLDVTTDIHLSAASQHKKKGFKDRVDGMVRGLIKEGIETGDMVDLPVDDLLHIYEELLSSFVARWAISGFAGDVREKIPVIKYALWNGLAASDEARRNVQ